MRTPSSNRTQAGRVPIGTIAIAFSLIVAAGAFYFSKESVETAGAQFMDALARGDVAKLTELSDIPGRTPDQIRNDWEFAVNKAAPYYRFRWEATGGDENGPDRGYVRLKVSRNVDSGGSYDENYQLPMRRINGRWKVAVAEISPEMFPALPR